MRPDFEGGGRRLARSRVLRVEDGRGVQVLVLDGTVWVTQDGDPNDYVLSAGQSQRFTEHGALLIQALDGDARPLLLDTGVHAPPRPAFERWRERVRQWRQSGSAPHEQPAHVHQLRN